MLLSAVRVAQAISEVSEDLVSTGPLPTKGRSRRLSSGRWSGESSLGLGGKTDG